MDDERRRQQDEAFGEVLWRVFEQYPVPKSFRATRANRQRALYPLAWRGRPEELKYLPSSCKFPEDELPIIVAAHALIFQ